MRGDKGMFKSILKAKENNDKKVIDAKDTNHIQEIVYQKQNTKVIKVSDDVLAKAIKDMLKK